ncbi:MAG TPA: tetratricopeptide repeat protein, partial [Verrucomicrobium sp.]|nr:tetratricopeptide repeat protein [Verrucomicrobium sp.]
MKMHLAVRIGISLGWVSWMAAPQLAFPAGSPPAARADLESSAVATPAVEIKGPAEQRAVAQAHYLTARSLEASGKQREALSHYHSFLSGDAGEPDLVAHIAELTLNYRGEDAAMELLEKGVKAHPDSPDPLGNLIQFCLTHGNAQNGLLQRAARTADQALKAFPDHAANYTAVVKLHLSQGQRDEAGKVLDSAFHKAKGDASFWLELARMAQEVWPLADQENRQAHVALNNAYMVRARDSANVAKDQAALIQIADYFLFSNQLDQAASICEALTAGPHGLEARKRLVRLYEAMER